MELVISASGNASTVYDEAIDLTSLGPLKISRASHVEPTADGEWLADLSPIDGPVLGPFAVRSVALAAEADWLNANWLTGPGSA